LQEAGKITEEVAIEESDNPDNMRLELMRRKVRARNAMLNASESF
jgi:hypothetical protein